MDELSRTLKFSEGREAYNAVLTELDGYWELDARILELATSDDADGYLEAQELDTTDLTAQYEQIYAEFVELMNLCVQKGDRAEADLRAMERNMLLVILAIVVVSFWSSVILGRKMAQDIEKPMIALADRLQTFAQGDLSSAFPECATEDEISYMIQVAKGMASDLDMIITDAGELLGQMAEGNYAIGTKIEDKYVGQFVALKDAMRKMNRQMNGTLHQVEEAAKQVSAGAENLAESAQSLAEGATDQAGSVEELTATITNIADAVDHPEGGKLCTAGGCRTCTDESSYGRDGSNQRYVQKDSEYYCRNRRHCQSDQPAVIECRNRGCQSRGSRKRLCCCGRTDSQTGRTECTVRSGYQKSDRRLSAGN